ncbi:hypothetical protein MMC24_000799 [Lignoscripta atroalba]|nr:hypothetical protein [Lignoscripta atroalba]
MTKSVEPLRTHPSSSHSTLAISDGEESPSIRQAYRPFLLDKSTTASDWISQLELSTVEDMVKSTLTETNQRLKVLVLYGSLRKRLMAYEAARILFRLGCDVRVFDPKGLPVMEQGQDHHEKVRELRELSRWSDGHIWCSPEQHGNLTAVFKNQIDWIPLATGSIRPTQGRTLGIIQVNGGSQSFNSLNSLRILGRWMRMFVIPNQSSLPMAYTQFTDEGDDNSRLLPSGNRDRLVDCMEEFVKYTIIMRTHFELFNDRYSERKVKKEKEAAAAAATASADRVNGVDLERI